MAKAERSVDRTQVQRWFSELAFEVQQSVLDDLGKSLETSKAARISKLEQEIEDLRGGVRTKSVGAVKPAKGGSPKKGVKVAPKYRHPQTGETWAGRGMQPTWMRDYLKKRGNKMDDLLIKRP